MIYGVETSRATYFFVVLAFFPDLNRDLLPTSIFYSSDANEEVINQETSPFVFLVKDQDYDLIVFFVEAISPDLCPSFDAAKGQVKDFVAFLIYFDVVKDPSSNF